MAANRPAEAAEFRPEWADWVSQPEPPRRAAHGGSGAADGVPAGGKLTGWRDPLVCVCGVCVRVFMCGGEGGGVCVFVCWGVACNCCIY